ncbi:MAG: cyclase family protein [Thaumarchaeota archaeon]|nr:cyclase family protein [Nitrososphaerota archaeon]
MPIIDLSLKLTEHMDVQGFPNPAFLTEVTHAWSLPRYLSPCKGMSKRAFLMDEHTGTHVDVPFHFDPDGPTLDRVPVDRFVGQAKLLDVSDRKPTEEVTRGMIEEAISRQRVSIDAGDIVLLRTTKARWGTNGYFDFKSLGKSAAEKLVELGARSVGIDLNSADTMSDLSKPAHTILCQERVPIYENLVQLGQIRRASFEFIGLPINMKGATGSPVRAVARI